jgi:hypothetical protein
MWNSILRYGILLTLLLTSVKIFLWGKIAGKEFSVQGSMFLIEIRKSSGRKLKKSYKVPGGCHCLSTVYAHHVHLW